MGMMKKVYMETVQQEQDDPAVEQFFPVEETCPSCLNKQLLRTKDEAYCERCGHSFIYVKDEIRYK